MYPNSTLPRSPASVITDRLDARAQPPIGVPSDAGGLQFNSDVMHQIIRIVAISGDRKGTCYLAQAHPYFFRETDSARVHAYLETQVARLGEQLTRLEFHALFSATLKAMHAAGDRLPMQDRLYFLVHLAVRATQLDDESFSSTKHFLLTIAAAGKSLQLDVGSGMDLFLFLMAGYSSIPGASPDRAPGLRLQPFQTALLEKCEHLPEAEKHALTLLSEVMTTHFDAAYVDDALARTADWPSAWQTCLLLSVSSTLLSYPESTRLTLATQLFGRMCVLPDGQRDAVLRALLGFISASLRTYFDFTDASPMLERLPVWLATCKSLSGSNLDFLTNEISLQLANKQRNSVLLGVQPADKARIDAASAELIALGLSIPAGQHGSLPAGLLELAASDPDVQKGTAAFKGLWAVAVSNHGLFPCLYDCFASFTMRRTEAREIPNFLFEQLLLLPDAEKYMVILPMCRFHRQSPLKPAVAYAIVEHLASIPSAMREKVIATLLNALHLDSGAGPIYLSGGSHETMNEGFVQVPPEGSLEAIETLLFVPGFSERGMSFTDADGILKRILALLPTMDEAALKSFFLAAQYHFDSGLLITTYTHLLDDAARMPLSSQKIIALAVLSRVPALTMEHLVNDDPYTALVRRAFGIVRLLPIALKAEALYALCTMRHSPDGQESSWDELFRFVLEECSKLPVQERGRLLHALAGAEDPTTLRGLQKLGTIRRQVVQLDAEDRDAWLLLIDLKSVKPGGKHLERDYATFLTLRARCAELADPDQRSTVMLEIASLESKFAKKGYPQDGRAQAADALEDAGSDDGSDLDDADD
jgi:hypothetical protein